MFIYIWAFMICRRTRIFVRNGPKADHEHSHSHSHSHRPPTQPQPQPQPTATAKASPGEPKNRFRRVFAAKPYV